MWKNKRGAVPLPLSHVAAAPFSTPSGVSLKAAKQKKSDLTRSLLNGCLMLVGLVFLVYGNPGRIIAE